MSKHNVRGMASGEYECSCGARWDRDEGGECPLGRIDGKQVTGQNETMENARVAALNGTLPEPKEVVSAGDERAAFEAAVRKHHQGDMRHLEARTDNGYYVHHIQELWLIWQARAALKAQANGVVLPEIIREAAMKAADEVFGEADCEWTKEDDLFYPAFLREVARLNQSANDGEPIGYFVQPYADSPHVVERVDDSCAGDDDVFPLYRHPPRSATYANHSEKLAKDAPYMSEDADPRETWAQGYNAAMAAMSNA